MGYLRLPGLLKKLLSLLLPPQILLQFQDQDYTSGKTLKSKQLSLSENFSSQASYHWQKCQRPLERQEDLGVRAQALSLKREGVCPTGHSSGWVAEVGALLPKVLGIMYRECSGNPCSVVCTTNASYVHFLSLSLQQTWKMISYPGPR